MPGSSGNMTRSAGLVSETKECGSDLVLEVPPYADEESQLQQLWETLAGLVAPYRGQ